MPTLSQSFAVAIIAALAACASKPPPPPFAASLTSSPDVNPDAEGRASPILVKVLILRADDKFARAGYFDLFDDPQTALGADLIGIGVSSVAPGATAAIEISTDAEAAFVGVIAGYQNVDKASWRDIAPVAAFGKGRVVMVTLTADKASIEK